MPNRIQEELTAILRLFAKGEMTAETFTDQYQKAWSDVSQSSELYVLNKRYANAFDRAFTAADCYEPLVNFKNDWSIDAVQLHAEISGQLREIEGT